jgi:hypothetical protein
MSLPPIVQESKLEILRDLQTDYLGSMVKRFEKYGDTYMSTFPFEVIISKDPLFAKHELAPKK